MPQHITVVDYDPMWPQAFEAERALLAEALGEFGIPGRRYLRKGGDERTHQVHIFVADDWYNIDRHLAVRDFLRNNREAREAYANIKRELAQPYPYDIDGYCAGKDEFVRELERQALAVYDGSRNRASSRCPNGTAG